MILVKRSFHALSPRFVGLNNASVFCLALLSNATGFPARITLNLARHCSWHRNFQLSTRILHDVLEFFIIRINEVDTTQFSDIVELRFFDSPLAFLYVSTRETYLSESVATKYLVLRSIVFLSVSPRTMFIHPVVFSSNIVNLVKLVHASDKSRSPSNIPVIVDVFLQHYIQ